MPKAQPKGPDLLALAMRRARHDVAAGRVPKHAPDGDMTEPDGPSSERPNAEIPRS